VSALRKAVREHDERAQRLGYVPRPLKVPTIGGSLEKIRESLERRSHAAMVKRIKRG
jgi:hypothetical protein